MMALRLVTTERPAPDEVPMDTLVAVAAGDRVACRAFVSCYERRVFTLCVRLLGDSHAAEDAAQETFWRGMRAVGTFDPRGPARLSTWLLTIATRQCLDELRRRRRHPTDGPLDAQADAPSMTSPWRADAAVDAAAEEARVMRALDTLSPDQRAVIVLRVLMERSVEETATSLAIETGTVKSRLSRARAVLAAALSGAPDGH